MYEVRNNIENKDIPIRMDHMKIRKAVGAVVFQNKEYLLVHKVKNANNEAVIGHWDLPKGGIEEQDEDLEMAILRELKEETGSDNYSIVGMFDNKICFTFPDTYAYDSQETVMFYVEYFGDRNDLNPQDDEIDEIMFYSKDDLLKIIQLNETFEFLEKVYNKI